MTLHEACVFSAFTGTLCCPKFSDFHEYCEKLLGRPIWTHQFPELREEIKEKSKPEFLKIVYSIEDDSKVEDSVVVDGIPRGRLNSIPPTLIEEENK